MGNENMIKCPNCDVCSAMHRATVRVCPKCGDILDAEELFRLLKELKIIETLIEKIKAEIAYEQVFS